MGNAIADSTPWRRRITLYSWPSAAASSLLMGSVTLISALCSTQLKQPKPTSWRSDAGVEPLLATLHYCELMDFCANSPALIAISSLPRVAESSLLCSPRVTLMLNNLPRSRPENPRQIARCSMSAVQRSQRVGDKSHVTEKSIRNKLFEVFEIFCANSPDHKRAFEYEYD